MGTGLILDDSHPHPHPHTSSPFPDVILCDAIDRMFKSSYWRGLLWVWVLGMRKNRMRYVMHY